MAEWNSERYLKFKEQRTQPAIDLAKRISAKNPFNILDIGCGPGNSTAILREVFPNADIIGVDSSENMIEKAKATYPDINFMLCDVTRNLNRLGRYDVIFSNACLQWIPNHQKFIPEIFDRLSEGGVLAVQIPMNGQEPLFRIIDEVTGRPEWGFLPENIQTNKTLRPEEYFDILSFLTDKFEAWETVYYHSMPDCEAMMEWVKGTRLRPYLSALDTERAARLESEILRRAKEKHKARANGEIIFKFRRFFFIAEKCRD